MEKKWKVMLFQIWAEIVLVGAALTALIIKSFKIAPFADQLGWGGTILLTIIVGLYFWGKYIDKKKDKYPGE